MNAIKDIKFSNTLTKGIWLPLLICFFIVAGTYISIFSLVAFALAVLAVVVLSDEDVLCLVMFIMPFANIFKSSPTSQSFFTYLTLFCVLSYFIKWYVLKKSQVNTAFLISFGLLCLFLMLQLLISIDILRTIKFIANILLVYFAVNTATKNDNSKVYFWYIIGIMLSSIVAVFNVIPNLSSYFDVVELGGFSEDIVRFTGLNPDPNYYSVNVIISLCLIVILNHKGQLRTIPSIILGMIMVMFAIITYSKSAFLMLMLPLFMLLYSRLSNRRDFVFSILFIFFLIFGAGIIIYRTGAFDIVLTRFSKDNDISSLTTGRSDIWISYFEYFKNSTVSLFFGGGFGAEILAGRVAHNTYIDLLYYLGIFGTILIIWVFVVLLSMQKISFKRNVLNYSVWLCILAMYFFLSELFYFDWAFHVVIAILVSKTVMVESQKDGNIKRV